MLRGTIRFAGHTVGDVAYAVEEALRLINETFTSGRNNNEDSAYEFTVDGHADAFEDDNPAAALNQGRLKADAAQPVVTPYARGYLARAAAEARAAGESAETQAALDAIARFGIDQ